MPSGVRISSVNLSGETANVTFLPYTGGTVNIGQVTIPFNYTPVDQYVYGLYQIYSLRYDYTYELEVPQPATATPAPTSTMTATPEPTLSPTSTPAPTSTVAPTATPAPTSTVAPTATPSGPSATLIYLSTGTDQYGSFENNQTLACYSLDCLRNSTCLSNSAISAYFSSPNPTVGDYLYVDNTLTTYYNVTTGYYINHDINFPVYTFLYHVINGQIVSINDCNLTTPTPTITVTSTPIPTSGPTSTPAPTSGPTSTPNPTPTDTPVPTSSPNPTASPNPTPTPTPPLSEGLLVAQIGSVFGNFSQDLTSACNALTFYKSGGQTVLNSYVIYVDTVNIGDYVYQDAYGNNVLSTLSGYFIWSVSPASSSELWQITNGQIVDKNPCSLPTPTPSPTSTAAPTPTPTETADCSLVVEGSVQEIDCSLVVVGSAIPIVGGGEEIAP